MHHVVAFRAGFHLVPGPLARTLAGHPDAAVQAGRGLFAKDTATWSTDPAVQQKIANRLGWLSSPALMAESVDRVKAFADGAVASFRTAVRANLPVPDPALLASALQLLA